MWEVNSGDMQKCYKVGDMNSMSIHTINSKN